VRLRETSAVSLIFPLALALSLVLAGLLAGCGGSGSSQDQSSGGGQQQKQEDKAGGKAAKKEPLSRKIAIGTVRAYKDDRRRLSLRPASKAQGEKPLGFKVRKKAQVTLDGEQAELKDIEEGQQAQIRYLVKNDINRAIIVQLFSKQPAGEDEKKKKPSGENQKKQPSKDAEKTG
jgi:hypothetical protein